MNEGKRTILITIDSLRADHLSCLGYCEKTSPNIDCLAKKGTLFSNAYSNGGGSVTSFPSIMTSTYPLMNPNSGGTNDVFWVKLSDRWTTIAESLRRNGIQTVAFKNTKVDIGSTFGYDRGFELFDDPSGHNEKVSKLRRKLNTLRGNKYERANLICQKAISWLKEHPDRFFLWLHYMDVHLPYNPKHISMPNRLQVITLEKKTNTNPELLSKDELKTLVNFCDKEINYVDAELGRFFAELERIGISSDNSYIILLSDHGDQHLEHGEWGHGRLYDEVLHVPLIMCGPHIDQNSLISKQVNLLSLAPTIVDLFGIVQVETFLGRSLLPLMNEKATVRASSDVLSEELGPTFSYRTDDWKYIMHERTKTHELYDIKKDPEEKVNLATEQKDVTEKIRRIILNHRIMEEKIAQLVSQEQQSFLVTNHEFLTKYPKKDKRFLSKISGYPLDISVS